MDTKDLIGYLGVDVGGQSVRVGGYVPDGDGARLEVRSGPTPPKYEDAVTLVADLARAIYPATARRVGVGSPGPLDWRTGRLQHTPNIPWQNVSYPETLGPAIGCDVVADNDANVAGLAEAVMGAGQGRRYVAGFTLGTGIGYFYVIDGHVFHGRLDVEGGHQVLMPDGPVCGCGNRGCLEGLASATAIERTWGCRPDELDDPDAWDQIARYIGQGLANVAVLTCPEVLILAGGMIQRGGQLLNAIRRHYRSFVVVYPDDAIPPVEFAKLGTDAGVIGAIVLAHMGHA